MKKIFKNILFRSVFLTKVYRKIYEEWEKTQPATQTPFGWKLYGSKQMASGSFESETLLCLKMLLKEVDIFVNVGANVGYFCCHALAMGKTVIAFEPNPRNIKFLLKNATQNDCWISKIEIWPTAVGIKTGVEKIWGWETGASLIQGWAGLPKKYFCHVPVTTLDRILAQRLKGLRALILVDVEGSELGVLQGASKILNMSPRPTWIIEIAGKMHQPAWRNYEQEFKKTFEVMKNAKYNCFMLRNLSIKKQIRAKCDKIYAHLINEKKGGNYLFY